MGNVEFLLLSGFLGSCFLLILIHGELKETRKILQWEFQPRKEGMTGIRPLLIEIQKQLQDLNWTITGQSGTNYTLREIEAIQRAALEIQRKKSGTP